MQIMNDDFYLSLISVRSQSSSSSSSSQGKKDIMHEYGIR
jgi:hypothetical protein